MAASDPAFGHSRDALLQLRRDTVSGLAGPQSGGSLLNSDLVLAETGWSRGTMLSETEPP